MVGDLDILCESVLKREGKRAGGWREEEERRGKKGRGMTEEGVEGGWEGRGERRMIKSWENGTR